MFSDNDMGNYRSPNGIFLNIKKRIVKNLQDRTLRSDGWNSERLGVLPNAPKRKKASNSDFLTFSLWLLSCTRVKSQECNFVVEAIQNLTL